MVLARSSEGSLTSTCNLFHASELNVWVFAPKAHFFGNKHGPNVFVSADKDDTPNINRGPSGRPDDPHMQVDHAADDHPAPKAG